MMFTDDVLLRRFPVSSSTRIASLLIASRQLVWDSADVLLVTELMALKKMAGLAGFEPAHDGIKIRCLTAWL
ncbi:hypothetical protein [Desertibacillus haloalkaliphilus]|uniref:hypothetical protein n=1 Tax=Desertibacillus haloalkaliphilus TaxID=1328930 RepID=UPI001C27F12F|nr:hypothetical protein [Desertibacillus haloalkaliphilus]MBU8909621.1 hypothetical protein [Desertibacillus haloalkaliphilus]